MPPSPIPGQWNSTVLALLAAGGIRLVPVSRAAFRHAADLVKQHRFGLRAGDSLHLAEALELGASHMATLDGTLADNAERKGLKRIVFFE